MGWTESSKQGKQVFQIFFLMINADIDFPSHSIVASSIYRISTSNKNNMAILPTAGVHRTGNNKVRASKKCASWCCWHFVIFLASNILLLPLFRWHNKLQFHQPALNEERRARKSRRGCAMHCWWLKRKGMEKRGLCCLLFVVVFNFKYVFYMHETSE